MQVKEIKIENYKGIVDAHVAFDDRMNVFVGSNGAGKTSLLEAIGYCLGRFINRFGGNSVPSMDIAKIINYDSDYFFLQLIVTNFTDIYSETNIDIPVVFHYGNKLKYTTEEKIKENNRTVLTPNTKLFKEAVDSKNNLAIPIIKFYPAKREVFVSNKKQFHSSVYKVPQLGTWDNFKDQTNSYTKFFNWFIERQFVELKLKVEAKNFKLVDSQLDGVRRTLQEAFKILRGKKYEITTDKKPAKGRNSAVDILVFKDLETKKSIPIESQSDGEKTIIALISDIAYNLIIANRNTEQDELMNGKGVVLIDEIEAHLHPKWQREIIPLLTKLFPNIQFFITTHSPQVVASVSSDNVFMCEDFKFNKINTKSKGTDTNTLLETVFGADARPKKYADLSDKFDDLIDKSADVADLQNIIDEVIKMEQEDPATDINPLSEELQFRLSAYQFEIEHEAN